MHSRDSIENVGPGWRPLVEAALTLARAIDPKLKVLQIKEKFGGLRLYIDSHDSAAHEACTVAELASMHVCEKCGARGSQTAPRGYMKTLCEEHAKQFGRAD